MESTATCSEVGHARPENSTVFMITLGVGVIAGLTGWLHATVLRDLALDWWNDPSSSHGILIPPLAVYLAWMRRANTLTLPPEPDARGLLLSGMACLVFLLGQLGAEFFVSRLSFVMLLAGFLW